MGAMNTTQARTGGRRLIKAKQRENILPTNNQNIKIMSEYYVVAVLVNGKPKYFIDCGFLSEERASGVWVGILLMAYRRYKRPAIILYKQEYKYGPLKAVHTCDHRSKDWYRETIPAQEMMELITP